MKRHRDCAKKSPDDAHKPWQHGQHLSVASSPISIPSTQSEERESIIDQRAAWSLGLSMPLSLLALASGEIMVQAMGLLLAATAGGFWLNMRLDRWGVANEENFSPRIPEVSFGERLLPVVFTLSTVVIVAAAIVSAWIRLHPGP